jgi:hypothetical protein
MKKRLLVVAVLPFVFLISGFQSRLAAQDRFELGAQLAFHHLPELGETPIGGGFRFTYNGYPPFLAFDSEINFFPTSSTGNLGETQAFFGLRAGVHVSRWGVYAKLRPGFVQFGGGGFPQRLTGRTNFALDLGGVIEYDIVPHIGLRWDLSDVMTHFGNAGLLAGPGPVGVPLGTQNNFETTIGAVVRF